MVTIMIIGVGIADVIRFSLRRRRRYQGKRTEPEHRSTGAVVRGRGQSLSLSKPVLSGARSLARTHAREWSTSQHFLTDSPKHLVRLVAQLEIEPAELAVVPSHYKMVAGRMHIQTRDPSDAREVRLHELLPRQIVQSNISLCLIRRHLVSHCSRPRQFLRGGKMAEQTENVMKIKCDYRDKEVRLERVECHSLHRSLNVLEWRLRVSLARLVNPHRSLSRARRCKKKFKEESVTFQNGLRSTPARTDGREIIALSVERDLRDLSRPLGELNRAQEVGGAARLRRGDRPLYRARRGRQRPGGRLSCVEQLSRGHVDRRRQQRRYHGIELFLAIRINIISTRVMDPSDPIKTLLTYVHTMKYDTSFRGHQATAETLPFRFQRAASWPVALSQSETNPDSSPDTTQSPPGLVDRHRTRASCLLSRMARYVGKGRSDCGEGSEGIRDSGSILSFVL